MAGDVFHGCVEPDMGRIRIDTNGSDKLYAGLRIRWAGQFDLTTLTLRELAKAKRSVIEQVRIPKPMLFIVAALGQKPEFVSAIIEPFVRARRKVFAGKLRIHEKIRVSVKGYLHQPSAVLRNDDQLNPPVRELLRVPAFIFDSVDSTV